MNNTGRFRTSASILFGMGVMPHSPETIPTTLLSLIFASLLLPYSELPDDPESPCFPNNLAKAFGPLPHVTPSQKQFNTRILLS